MNLEFKRFRQEYYAEYASWFVDPEVPQQLIELHDAQLAE
jgi:hypothetical protein